jgi:hypothetical protein
MVTKYNPAIGNIKKKLLKYWHTLSREPELKEIFKDKPIIAYKKHRNLGDLLTSSKLK